MGARVPSNAKPDLHGVSATDLRLAELEQRVEDLTARLDNAISSLVKLTQVVRGIHGGPSALPREPSADAISPRMLEVIQLILQGESESAQALLQEIPTEERNSQPAVVALAAAAMCIQREDYGTAAKALERARSFTSDPRLAKVLDKIAERAATKGGG